MVDRIWDSDSDLHAEAETERQRNRDKQVKPNGSIIIDPSAPYTTAKLFRELYFTVGAKRLPTLFHHKGGFYRWTGEVYTEIAERELRSNVYCFLDKTERLANKKQVPVKPTTTHVSHVLDGLRAAAHLAEGAATPTWIDPSPADLNTADIIACANGLLHLPTQELLPNTPRFFNLNAVDFAFDAQAPDPTQWLAFLNDLWPDDDDSIETLQEIFGLALTGDTNHEKAFLIVGPKRSGKGTIGRVLRRLVGISNTVAPTLSSFSERFGMAPLIGKRVALISDARLSSRADQHVIAERLLTVTGEDAITIDRKYDTAGWTGQLQTRFVILSNELPRIADASGALASRFIVLVLTASFFGREDHNLTDRLLGQLPGIFNWALNGLIRLRARGRFMQPASALEEVKELEDLGSPIGAFIRDRCRLGPTATVEVNRLFEAWTEWCKAQGRDYSGDKARFGRDLRAACPGLKITQPRDGTDRLRIYQGIGL